MSYLGNYCYWTHIVRCILRGFNLHNYRVRIILDDLHVLMHKSRKARLESVSGISVQLYSGLTG